MPVGLKALLARTPARVFIAVVILATAALVARATELVGPSEPAASPTAEATAGAASPSASASPSGSPSPGASPGEATEANWNLEGGGGRNIVRVVNQSDARFILRGSIDLNRTPGPNVGPVNFAYSRASCADCRTLAVALQINLYERGAPKVTPQNAAVAVNVGCTGCATAAYAAQYVIPVDELQAVPRDVDALAREMDAELRGLAVAANQGSITPDDAMARLDALLERFRDLARYLKRTADIATEQDSPDASPSVPADETSPPTSPAPSPGEGGTTESPTPPPTETAGPSP
jgi:hypothetical protein